MTTYQGWTLRGARNVLAHTFRGEALPDNFYVALVTDDAPPDSDTVTFSELTEISAGNGYVSGGYELDLGATDFDTLVEDSGNKRTYMRIKDLAWTASGGPLPGSGDGARYAVLIDDKATPEVWYFWDLISERQVSNGQALTLSDLEFAIRTFLST